MEDKMSTFRKIVVYVMIIVFIMSFIYIWIDMNFAIYFLGAAIFLEILDVECMLKEANE